MHRLGQFADVGYAKAQPVRRIPYLLAYNSPLGSPCKTNALSQEGAYHMHLLLQTKRRSTLEAAVSEPTISTANYSTSMLNDPCFLSSKSGRDSGLASFWSRSIMTNEKAAILANQKLYKYVIEIETYWLRNQQLVLSFVNFFLWSTLFATSADVWIVTGCYSVS